MPAFLFDTTPHPPFGHLLPQGEKGGTQFSHTPTHPSPLAGEGQIFCVQQKIRVRGSRLRNAACSGRSITPHPALRATFSRKGTNPNRN